MTCIGGLLNTVTGSVILTADEVKEVEGHIDQLNAENARLRSCLSDDAENAKLIMAENAKLREERRAYQATIDSLVDECTDYETENAKLRELVAELWALADGYTPDDSELDTARDLMRELGIEVPS